MLKKEGRPIRSMTKLGKRQIENTQRRSTRNDRIPGIKARPPMTLRRKIFVGVLVFVAGVAALGIIQHYRAQARFETYQKKLTAQGEKLTIAASTPIASPRYNGAPEFQQATRGTNLNYIAPLLAVPCWRSR
jgi:hypothetical protein